MYADLRFALDPVLFCTACLGFHPDPWQADVLRGGYKRLLLNCCRQSGKSMTAAALSVHRALYYSDSLILLVSPSLRQSSELFRKVTNFLRIIPIKPCLVEDNKLSMQLHNGSRVVSLPGSETTVRGFSNVNLIIEDEAARVSDDLYRAIRPMLAVSGGNLILTSTPRGKIGHFFREWSDGSEWKRVRIPATECPRISSEFLEGERGSLGKWWFRQEYLCEFVEAEDQLFKYDEVMEALDDQIEPLSLL